MDMSLMVYRSAVVLVFAIALFIAALTPSRAPIKGDAGREAVAGGQSSQTSVKGVN